MALQFRFRCRNRIYMHFADLWFLEMNVKADKSANVIHMNVAKLYAKVLHMHLKNVMKIVNQWMWTPLRMHFFFVRIPNPIAWKRKETKVTNILYLPRKLVMQITHIQTFNSMSTIKYIAYHTIYWQYVEYCTIQSQYTFPSFSVQSQTVKTVSTFLTVILTVLPSSILNQRRTVRWSFNQLITIGHKSGTSKLDEDENFLKTCFMIQFF